MFLVFGVVTFHHRRSKCIKYLFEVFLDLLFVSVVFNKVEDLLEITFANLAGFSLWLELIVDLDLRETFMILLRSHKVVSIVELIWLIVIHFIINSGNI